MEREAVVGQDERGMSGISVSAFGEWRREGEESESEVAGA